jgi:hypothetical protein
MFLQNTGSYLPDHMASHSSVFILRYFVVNLFHASKGTIHKPRKISKWPEVSYYLKRGQQRAAVWPFTVPRFLISAQS